MKDKFNAQTAFVKMRIEGKPLVEAAPALGISIATAYRWNRLFKSDILSVRDAKVEALRQKVLDKYNSYFDFLDSQLEKIKDEIELHDEIAMTYERCIKYSIKILEAQNRLNIFRKFSYKPYEDNPPDIPKADKCEEPEEKANEEANEEAKDFSLSSPNDLVGDQNANSE